MMQIKKSDNGFDKITLYHNEVGSKETYRGHIVDVTIEQERFNIFLWMGGASIKKVYGDWDIEEWLFIEKEEGESLVKLCCDDAKIEYPEGKYDHHHVFQALYKIYANDKDAFEKLKDLLKNNNFKHEYQYYH